MNHSDFLTTDGKQTKWQIVLASKVKIYQRSDKIKAIMWISRDDNTNLWSTIFSFLLGKKIGQKLLAFCCSKLTYWHWKLMRCQPKYCPCFFTKWVMKKPQFDINVITTFIRVENYTVRNDITSWKVLQRSRARHFSKPTRQGTLGGRQRKKRKKLTY